MVDSDVASLGKEKEIIYSCAYNFPAVIDALGTTKWETELFKVYDKLLKENDKVNVWLYAENKSNFEWKFTWNREDCRIGKDIKIPV